jgi:hypothetical protein
MKYWKGKAGTSKEGQCGTMDDTGSVPDSNPATEAEYTAWVAAQPVPVPVITQMQTDIATLDLTSLADAKLKLRSLLERLRSGER